MVSFLHTFGRSRRQSGILEPFRQQSALSVLQTSMLACALFAFCFFYGAAFGLFAPYVVVPFVALMAIPAALVVWALPDLGEAPTKTLEFFLFSFLVVTVMWPNYLAVALPGLPWITLSRLIGMPLAITLLICLSISTNFRSELASIMRSAPWLRNATLAFAVLQTLSIVFSTNTGGSIDALISAQTNWTAIFATSCYVCANDRLLERVALLLCILAVAVGVLGIWEFVLGHPPWIGHIPSFFQVNDPSVGRILGGGHRSGRIRVQGPFTTSLGLAEFFALAFPFVLHFAIGNHRAIVRAAGVAAALLVVLAVVLTQSRLGLVGLFVTCVAYPYALAIPRWKRKSQSLVVGSMIILSPIILVSALATTFAIPGIRYRMWGGSNEEASNQGRIDQINMGIPKILSHPWGYGIGQGAESLGFHTPVGLLTIDSGWLKIALEYGIAGFFLFLAIILTALFYAARGALQTRNAELESTLFVPIGISLLNFLIIKTTFAGDDNYSIFYLVTGMLVALLFRTSADGKKGTDRRSAETVRHQLASEPRL